MVSITITELKAHLRAEIKRVRGGESLTILDHQRPVARLVPLPSAIVISKKAQRSPEYRVLEPLINQERAD
jgi:prevent-host-death family protein